MPGAPIILCTYVWSGGLPMIGVYFMLKIIIFAGKIEAFIL